MKNLNNGIYDYVSTDLDFVVIIGFQKSDDIELYCNNKIHMQFVKNNINKIFIKMFDLVVNDDELYNRVFNIIYFYRYTNGYIQTYKG